MQDEIYRLTMSLKKDQKNLFNARYEPIKKTTGKAFLFAFFLGGFGGHKYYLGQTGLGIAYTLFFWTGIPGLIAIIELFFLKMYVNNANLRIAKSILMTIS